jgi:hypothetical protein
MSSVLAELQVLLPAWVRELSTAQIALAVFVGFPVLAVALNVLRQVVSARGASRWRRGRGARGRGAR